jgi:hypothetical protein
MLDDLLAVLWVHPQVHVAVGIICYALPRKSSRAALAAAGTRYAYS